MIHYSREILSQSVAKAECILREFVEGLLDTLVFSIIEVLQEEHFCTCGKKLIKTKTDAQTTILTTHGHIRQSRDLYFCRRCHKGHGVMEQAPDAYEGHRMTPKMAETVAYVEQLVSFDRGEELLKKLMEVGCKVFEENVKEAQVAYERPEGGQLYIMADGLQVNTRIEDENGSTW
jgi:hypothetical protein